MTVVLDASAALWVVLDQGPPKALVDALSQADRVIAPQQYILETASALVKYVRRGLLQVKQAEKAHAQALALVNTYTAHDDIIRESTQVALATGRSVYDSAYLVTARRHAASLLTRDGPLATTAHQLGVEVPGQFKNTSSLEPSNACA